MNILFRPVDSPPSPLTSISTSPKGHLIVCGTMSGQILLLDSKSGKVKQDLIGHDGAISAVSFTGKSSSIVSCGWDKTTKLWNTKRKEEPILLKHGSEVKALSISVPLSKGASGARDGEVKVFSLTSLKCIRNLQAHRTDVSGIAFSGEEKRLITASYDGECKVWDLSSYEPVTTLVDSGPRIRSLTISADGSSIYLSHGDGTILRISTDDRRDTLELRGHSDVVSTMSINPSGNLLASGSWDRTLRVWSLDDFQVIATEKLVTGIASLEWSHDEDVIYSADFSGSIVSWSL